MGCGGGAWVLTRSSAVMVCSLIAEAPAAAAARGGSAVILFRNLDIRSNI